MSKQNLCSKCKRKVGKNVVKCRKCSRKDKNKMRAIVIIATVVILAIVGTVINKKNTQSTESEIVSTENKIVEIDNAKVTYDNFNLINLGMEYEDVTDILGYGVEASKTTKDDGNEIKVYTWEFDTDRSIRITLENNYVTGKSQSGLGDVRSDINLEKYNMLSKDMSYYEIKDILGEGIVESQIKSDDVEWITFLWKNKDDSNISVLYVGGAISAITQKDLN